MKKWIKRLGKTLLGIIVFFIVACFVFDALVQFRMSDEEWLRLFSLQHINGEVHYFTSAGRTVRYISAGSDTLPTIVFIHGAPSSSSIYKIFFTDSLFLHTFHVLAIDRPGYGYSGFGKPVTSLQQQAAFVKEMIEKSGKTKHPVIVVAGSYGTSVACRFAMDDPQLVAGLVLTGPALGAGLEHTYWFTPAVENPLINWFIPRMFKSANKEKITHKEELAKMLPLWKNIQVPVMYMQGEKDGLIDTSNASFAKQHLVNAPYLYIHFFKGRPHFIPFSEHNFIEKKIYEMLALVQQDNNKNTSFNTK